MLIEFSQVTIEVFWNFVAALHIILHQNETTLISQPSLTVLWKTITDA